MAKIKFDRFNYKDSNVIYLGHNISWVEQMEHLGETDDYFKGNGWSMLEISIFYKIYLMFGLIEVIIVN